MAQHFQFYYNVGPFEKTSEGFTEIPRDGAADTIGVELQLQQRVTNILQLGIQAPPGTEIKINNTTAIIGKTGIFELTNNDGLFINNIIFYYPEQVTLVDSDGYNIAFTALLDAEKRNANTYRQAIQTLFTRQRQFTINDWNFYYRAYEEFVNRQASNQNNFLTEVIESYNTERRPCKNIIVDILGTQVVQGGAN